MKGNMEERACALAAYIIENRATVRAAAKKFGVSKSTVHKDIGALAVVQHGLHVLAAEVLDLLIVQEQNAFFHCCLPLC